MPEQLANTDGGLSKLRRFLGHLSLSLSLVIGSSIFFLPMLISYFVRGSRLAQPHPRSPIPRSPTPRSVRPNAQEPEEERSQWQGVSAHDFDATQAAQATQEPATPCHNDHSQTVSSTAGTDHERDSRREQETPRSEEQRRNFEQEKLTYEKFKKLRRGYEQEEREIKELRRENRQLREEIGGLGCQLEAQGQQFTEHRRQSREERRRFEEVRRRLQEQIRRLKEQIRQTEEVRHGHQQAPRASRSPTASFADWRKDCRTLFQQPELITRMPQPPYSLCSNIACSTTTSHLRVCSHTLKRFYRSLRLDERELKDELRLWHPNGAKVNQVGEGCKIQVLGMANEIARVLQEMLKEV